MPANTAMASLALQQEGRVGIAAEWRISLILP